MSTKPRIGQHVIYRGAGAPFDLPAVVTCTFGDEQSDLVEKRLLRVLSGADCVHLTVFTPITTEPTGSFQVLDVPHESTAEGGTKSWRELELGPEIARDFLRRSQRNP